MSATSQTELTGQRNIVETAGAGQELSMLAAAFAAAELVDTLASPGPFTVFAPTNAAFAKLPPGEIETLFKPENRRRLTSFVTYHILAGQLTVAEMRQRAQANEGHLTLRTVEGDTINIDDRGDRLQIVDGRGSTAALIVSDLIQSNGIIHFTDSVLSPPA